MAFDIQIKVDPGNTIPTLKKVEDGLSAAEKKAKDAAQAISSGMKSAEPAVRSLNEQIDRERKMLESIHGPAQKAAQDFQTLTKLHNEGRISAEQYIHTLEKLGMKIESLPSPKQQAKTAFDTISLGTDDKGALNKPKAVGGIDPLAAAGAAGAALAVAHEFMELDDAYTHSYNSALKFADAGHSVTGILAEQRTMAHDLKLGLDGTLAAYDAVRDATDELNLTHEQQIRVTSEVSKIATLDGKSAEALASSLYEVKVAQEAGLDPGRQMVTLFKQYPTLAEHMQKQLHATTGEIVEMAKRGDLSYDAMTRTIITGTEDIDNTYGKVVKTWTQDWDDFKDTVSTPVLMPGTAAYDQFVDLNAQIDRTVKDVQKLTAHWHELEDLQHRVITGDYKATRIDNAEQRAAELGYKRAAAIKEAQISLDAESIAYQKGKIPLAQYTEESERLRDIINGTTAASRGLAKELTDEQKLLERLHGASYEQSKGLAVAAYAYGNAKISLAEYNDEVFRLMSLTGDESHKSVANFGMIQPMVVPKPPTPDEGISMWQDSSQARTAAWNAELEQYRSTAEHQAQMIAKAFSPIQDALTGFFETGKFGWSAFGKAAEKTFEEIAFEIIKEEALLAIFGAGGGKSNFGKVAFAALGGFSGGGDFMASTMPHASAGNDWMVRGGGATDTRLVQFMASDNESVHIRTPSQRAVESGSTPARTGASVSVNMYEDRRQLVDNMDSRLGERVFAKLDRKKSRRR